MAKEFRGDGERIYINVPYAEAYIPMDLMGDPQGESTVASYYGDHIQTIGLFNMRFFSSDKKDREEVRLRTFNYPTVIDTYPTDYQEDTLTLHGVTDRYLVLCYYMGDVMMNRATRRSSAQCEKFLNLIMRAKIPSNISYPDLFYIWMRNLEINKVDPGVPSMTLQTILSEQCRNPKNPAQQFRKIAGKGNVDMHSYKLYNMNDVSSFSSVFASLIFERFSDKLVTSFNMTKKGTPQAKSPVEQIISM